MTAMLFHPKKWLAITLNLKISRVHLKIPCRTNEIQRIRKRWADKIRKEELLLSIALSEYKQVIFDILTPIVEGAKITLTPIKGNVKDK